MNIAKKIEMKLSSYGLCFTSDEKRDFFEKKFSEHCKKKNIISMDDDALNRFILEVKDSLKDKGYIKEQPIHINNKNNIES